MQDPIFDLIDQEKQRQQEQINLIPSENITSAAVRRAVGSELMHKYSEGNIGKRYYEGNNYIDEIEQLAQARAHELFQLPDDWAVNVQALSGSNANLAAMLATLNPGDTILSMYLADGGHLSHGWSFEPKTEAETQEAQTQLQQMTHLQGQRKVHVVSKLFNVVQYKTNPDTQLLDYDAIEKIAVEQQPQMIITGGTAYPRNIDYQRMKEIANKVGAYYLADIAHESGLVASGSLPSPVDIADIVTMTTHKSLRAARGALILANQEIIKKVNRAILPGLQGGPFNNNIAGIAVGLQEALQPSFKDYTDQIIKNAQTLAEALQNKGYKVVSNGTDKHLVLVNTVSKGITGKQAAKALAAAGIICNMNTIPWDERTPRDPSGIRLGTPWITTQGAGEADMRNIAEFIDQTLAKALAHQEEEDFESTIKNDTDILKLEKQAQEFMRTLLGNN